MSWLLKAPESKQRTYRFTVAAIMWCFGSRHWLMSAIGQLRTLRRLQPCCALTARDAHCVT